MRSDERYECAICGGMFPPDEIETLGENWLHVCWQCHESRLAAVCDNCGDAFDVADMIEEHDESGVNSWHVCRGCHAEEEEER